MKKEFFQQVNILNKEIAKEFEIELINQVPDHLQRLEASLKCSVAQNIGNFYFLNVM